MSKRLTEAETRALKGLVDMLSSTSWEDQRRGVLPKELAARLWPDSPAWRRVSNCGNTSRRGGQMGAAAGLILHRLRRKGYASGREHETTGTRYWHPTDRAREIFPQLACKNGWNFHVYGLGANKCSICGAERS